MEKENLEREAQDDEYIAGCEGIIKSKTINYINIETVHNLNSASFEPQEQNTPSPSTPLTPVQTIFYPETRFQNIFRRVVNLSRLISRDSTLGLKQKLQWFYMESTLPCVAWLDRGQDLLISDYYTELQLDSSNTTIPLEKIFARVNMRKPLRILIEGQPGYGKTTLATKIVHDWALSKNYIKQFKLTFLLPLRELRHRTVFDAIKAVANHCGFKRSCRLNNILEDNVSSILLIIDGLDELSVSERMPILKLMFKQEYAEMTVIVTCRTGVFSLELDELNVLFGGISKKKEFYDKRIRVLGIGIEDRKKFLLKFSSPNSADDVISQAQHLTKPIADMFRSPLFLILLAFMTSKKNYITSFLTKTQLFKKLFNFTIKHSLRNNSTDLETEFDLFDLNSTTPNNYQQTIQKFGQLALEHILKNNMQFECNQLTTQIYEMGFLINHKEISLFETSHHYEAFHLSILEFAAAFSIWMDYKQQPSFSSLDSIQFLFLKLDRSSLILPFLIGLLQTETTGFFHQLSPLAHTFSANENNLWHLLTEYETNTTCNNLLSNLTDFIPQHVHQLNDTLINFYQSEFYENLIKFAIHNGKLKQIYINNTTPSNLPKNVVIPMLWVDILPRTQLKVENMLTDVKCKTLVLRFNTGFRKQDESLIWNYISLLSSLPTDSCCLYMDCSLHMDEYTVYDVISRHIDDGHVKQIKFNNLRLHVTQAIKKDFISTLLQRNQVETLQLFITYFSTEIKPENIITAAANSAILQSLQIISNLTNNMPIDLYHLTNGGNKQYNCLMLKNSTIECRNQLENKNCIHSIIIKETFDAYETKTYQSVEALNQIHPVVLECDVSLFYKLPVTWTGYTKLNELALSIDNPSSDVQFWRHLSHCKNLKMLELIFPVSGVELTLAPVDEIVKCLQQLPIQRFVMWRVKAKHGAQLRLIQSVIESLPWSISGVNHLKTVDLACLFSGENKDQVDNLCLIISNLLNCLKLNYLQSVNIICMNRSLWHSLMQKHFIDFSVFYVKHLIHGSCADDPEYYKIWYNAFSCFSYNTFCIRLK